MIAVSDFIYRTIIYAQFASCLALTPHLERLVDMLVLRRVRVKLDMVDLHWLRFSLIVHNPLTRDEDVPVVPTPWLVSVKVGQSRSDIDGVALGHCQTEFFVVNLTIVVGVIDVSQHRHCFLADWQVGQHQNAKKFKLCDLTRSIFIEIVERFAEAAPACACIITNLVVGPLNLFHRDRHFVALANHVDLSIKAIPGIMAISTSCMARAPHLERMVDVARVLLCPYAVTCSSVIECFFRLEGCVKFFVIN
mmetsp:Transcript_47433/g.94668  ORF Transcript_47433/g.94668 Transcript_47433/m.94668 type:complete len:250 (+) Transcript_47433:851-1600(+)